MISKPITPSPVPANQRQKPRLIEFLPTEPALLTTKTVLRALSSSTHTAKSPRTPKLELGKAIALSPENISFHSGLSLSIPSPRDGVMARTITEEVFPGPLEASPGIQMMEHEIPASKTSPIQIASIPSAFVDDRVENSAPSKSSHPDRETGSSGEDMDSIRKGFSSTVWGRIAKAKYYPPLARKQGWEGKPIVEFRLARNGDLLSSSIALSSPYKILNEAALGAVKNAVPYPKFPKALKLDSIRFKLPISFILSGAMKTTRLKIRLILYAGFLFLSLASLAEGVVIQIDSDFDGKLDQWQHKSEDDHLLKVEYDKNGDGKIDQIDVFDGNEKPIRVELDRNFDGTMDQVQHYSKDFILKYIEKDSKFSGLIDWREVYGPE